ncbi:MAG: pyridoxal phosphate-dependent aminotransferase [bacterium]|nr:pyridoxal phosphate-dependent aminotransferase [bacterium]
MLRISKRSENVIASPIRKFLPMAAAAEKKGIKVFKLNVGDSDIPVPEIFLKTVKQYKDKNIKYAPSSGIPEHVNSWIKYYSTFNINLKPENIIPTVGCAEAILFAILAVTDPGDEILIFEPVYPSYKGLAAICNVSLVPIALRVENNFALPPKSEIVKKITNKTKAVVIINPNNPTGAILNEKEIKEIIQIAKERNLFIIADETYREIVFSDKDGSASGGGKPTSFLQYPEVKDHVIALDSVSKKFSCPGARIGALTSFNMEVMKTVLKIAMVRLSAPTLEQYGMVPLLLDSKKYTKKIIAEYEKRRDIVFSFLQKMPGVTCLKPSGALYIIAKLPVASAEKFVEFLLTEFNYKNETVLVTPIKDFYITPGMGVDEIRIAYVINQKDLKKAMMLLQKGLQSYLSKYATN